MTARQQALKFLMEDDPPEKMSPKEKSYYHSMRSEPEKKISKELRKLSYKKIKTEPRVYYFKTTLEQQIFTNGIGRSYNRRENRPLSHPVTIEEKNAFSKLSYNVTHHKVCEWSWQIRVLKIILRSIMDKSRFDILNKEIDENVEKKRVRLFNKVEERLTELRKRHGKDGGNLDDDGDDDDDDDFDDKELDDNIDIPSSHHKRQLSFSPPKNNTNTPSCSSQKNYSHNPNDSASQKINYTNEPLYQPLVGEQPQKRQYNKSNRTSNYNSANERQPKRSDLQSHYYENHNSADDRNLIQQTQHRRFETPDTESRRYHRDEERREWSDSRELRKPSFSPPRNHTNGRSSSSQESYSHNRSHEPQKRQYENQSNRYSNDNFLDERQQQQRNNFRTPPHHFKSSDTQSHYYENHISSSGRNLSPEKERRRFERPETERKRYHRDEVPWTETDDCRVHNSSYRTNIPRKETANRLYDHTGRPNMEAAAYRCLLNKVNDYKY